MSQSSQSKQNKLEQTLRKQYKYELCEGINEIPKNFKKLDKLLMEISDNWDSQIACV